MFWKLTALSASSPVESILDKENFSLEELLDEEEIIQECKALNSRLINFLRDRAQVGQLLRYIVEEPSDDADSKHAFKFPFISCEIFTCEIDVILKTLAEEEELMNLLFSFLEPNRSHSVTLAGYFSKVVICLMIRKTVPLMNYVQEIFDVDLIHDTDTKAAAHQNVFRQLVDLIGITSIMEVLIRLVGADDHVHPNFLDVMQWLADSDLLEMIVDKLSSSSPPEVHGNAAETLCAITRNAPSALATKLSSPSFVARIFDHALEDSHSKSSLVHSLSVCISLLDPRRSAVSAPFMYSFRTQHIFESPIPVNPETISAMLPKLGDLLMLLNVTSDDKILPTTYGELRPPLGKHRLKIVEFIAVLLKTRDESTANELVSSGTIKRILDLFFEYPYNNALHHHVESIILSCLESKNEAMVDHLLQQCDLIGKILQTDKHPVLSGDNQPTVPAAGKNPPRAGNIGHITRLSNKLFQLAASNSQVKAFLEDNNEWNEWQTNVLQERTAVENVYRWACGRPTALHDRTRDSDEEDLHDKDYDVADLPSNLSPAFTYKIYENDGAEEGHGANDRNDEDIYFDDESAEVVISSLRLDDEQGSNLFTNSNWFTFQDDRFTETPIGTTPLEIMDEVNLNETINGANSSSDDEVVLGEDEVLTAAKNFPNSSTSTSQAIEENPNNHAYSGTVIFNPDAQNPFLGLSHMQVSGSHTNPFLDDEVFADASIPGNDDVMMPDVKVLQNGSPNSKKSSEGSESSPRSPPVPSLFEEDVEFVGVEPEGTEKAMEQALKEGIVGEAGPMKRNLVTKVNENENADDRINEFNDANYWRIEQEVAVLE